MGQCDQLFAEHERTIESVLGPPGSLRRIEALVSGKLRYYESVGLLDPDWDKLSQDDGVEDPSPWVDWTDDDEPEPDEESDE